MKVKIFEEKSKEALEEYINVYLVQFFNAEVVEIKFQTSLRKSELIYSAFVITYD